MKTANLALSLLALLFIFDDAYACRCARRKPSANISGHAAVFSGKVVNIKFTQLPGLVGRYRVTFKVERVWQGEVKEETMLITRATSCDFRFREGESYLVFAGR
jgi:hypothetical protein